VIILFSIQSLSVFSVMTLITFKTVSIFQTLSETLKRKWADQLWLSHIKSQFTKTRLVTRDFSQAYNVDYENIFILIIKFDTLQVFLVIIALKNLKCHSVNVNNIFMKFFLKKTIYITFFSEINIASDCVLHILHNLYDLKQIT